VDDKRTHKACFQPGPKLDKKPLSFNLLTFAHSLLWICMGLSTSGSQQRRRRAFDAALTWPKSANFFVQADVIHQRA
jgi:hypothetical protein